MRLYKSEGYTNYLDYGNPIVQGLLARKFIYMGNNQVVSLEWDNSVPAKFALQPFVYQALNHEIEKMQKEIRSTTKKIAKTKNKNKKEKLQAQLNELQQCWRNYEEF